MAPYGALGICASGGYVPFAATTDHRIKAVATVSAADMGALFREGLGGGQDPRVLAGMLEASARARTAEAAGGVLRYDPVVPETPQEAEGAPTLYREGTDYYRTSRARHPNSAGICSAAWTRSRSTPRSTSSVSSRHDRS